MLKALVEGGRETEVTLRRGKNERMYKMYVMEFLLDSKVLVNTNESTGNLKVGLFYLDNTITEY